MIQRIQSLYFVFAFFLLSGLLYYSILWNEASWISENQLFYLNPTLVLLSIFLFKKRMLQARLCLLSIVIQLVLVGYYGVQLFFEVAYPLTYFVFGFSLASILLLFLARRAILKDEALVRSVDRIR
jgi:hypothetical protein